MRPVKLTARALGPYPGELILDFRELGDRTLFLIHGPTGSGKTTILDAMTFALYGECSGGEREVKRIRSDFADPQLPAEVVFDFRVGAETYRIHRRPEQQRPSIRGKGGTATLRAEATLTRRTGLSDDSQDGTVIAAQWSKVTKTVESLLGFKGDQFRQVVVLPQGQFRRLLLADSRDRQSILEVLFQTELFKKIEEALKQASKEIEDKARDLRQHLQFILNQAQSESVQDLTEKLESTRRDLSLIRSDLDIVKTEERLAQERLEEARRTSEKLAELERSERELSLLQRQVPTFENKRKVLIRARNAASVIADEKALQHSIRESGKATERLRAAREQLNRAAQAKESAEKDLARETARDSERDAARQQIGRLEDLTEKVQELDKATRNCSAAQGLLSEKIRELDEVKVRLQECEEKIERNKKLLADCERLAAQRELLHHKAEQAEKVRTNILRLQQLGQSESDLRSQLHDVGIRLSKAQQEVDRVASAVEKLEQEWVQGQAAVLAQHLQAGVPCPVCGATEHPAPAGTDRELPSERSLKTKKTRLNELREETERIKSEKVDLERRLSEVRARATLLDETLGDQTKADLHEIEAGLLTLNKELKIAEAAEKRMRVLSGESGQLQDGLRRIEASRDRVEREQSTALGEYQRAEAAVTVLEAGIPEELRTKKALKLATQDARRRLQVLEAAWEEAQKALSRSKEHLASCTAALEGAEQAAAEANRQVLAHREDYAGSLKAAGFLDEEEFQSAKKSGAEVDSLDQEIQGFYANLNSAQDRVVRAREVAQGLTAPDLNALEKVARDVKERLQAILRTEAALAETVKSADRLSAEYAKSSAELADWESRYAVAGRIAEVANGQNPQGITFQRFVLASLLDDVLVAASERLEIMSNRRYALQRREERTDKRVAGGLDLEVLDSYTGKARPVSTLSGGESFLASLSLALGLADVVQSYAGGIRLDTIFVDEGFGSLDPESLDLAFRALVDLQRGGRLVGIISHVPDLRERIDTRLEVMSNRRGSTARFVVC